MLSYCSSPVPEHCQQLQRNRCAPWRDDQKLPPSPVVVADEWDSHGAVGLIDGAGDAASTTVF